MSRAFLIGLALLLAGCPDERGTVGHYCRPDGSCVSSLLSCVPVGTVLGMPLDEPSCQPKALP